MEGKELSETQNHGQSDQTELSESIGETEHQSHKDRKNALEIKEQGNQLYKEGQFEEVSLKGDREILGGTRAVVRRGKARCGNSELQHGHLLCKIKAL